MARAIAVAQHGTLLLGLGLGLELGLGLGLGFRLRLRLRVRVSLRCGGVRCAVARRHHDEQAVGLAHGEDLLDLAHELDKG